MPDFSLEKVDLFVSGRDLPSVQLLSTTDAFCVIHTQDPKSKDIKPVRATPIVKESLNPDWLSPLTIDYFFEIVQEVKLQVYHYNLGEGISFDKLDKHTLLGEASFTLADLVRTPTQKLELELGGTKYGKGRVEVRAEVQVNTRDLFKVKFEGKKLANKDGWFGRSDPFLVISRMNEDGSFNVVWQSPRIDNDLNPKWKESKIPMVQLCNGDVHRPLSIEIFDWDHNGKHDSMGKVETSVDQMIGANGAPMKVIMPKNKDGGHLLAVNAAIEHHPTFTDFISGDCELSLMVAIDYTASNGDPALPSSLHYLDASHATLNPYETVITTVGRIVDQYDSDKLYPVLGFGARVRDPNGNLTPAQHCFPIYGGGAQAAGVDGILKAYRDSLSVVNLSGPTLFAPTIQHAAQVAANSHCSQTNQKYHVLLIITDGTINDMDATKAAIVAASDKPLSIVIVGVGSADFSGMRELDADKGLLSHNGKSAERDIVQFVAHTNQDYSVLASEVLAEIPNQLIKFMESHNIEPNKKKE